jgi:hypothetical protein
MKAALYMATGLILTGCAGAPTGADTQSFVGQNVSVLTSRLGSPATQAASGGDTAYTWSKVETVDGIVDGQEFQATQSAQGSSRFNATKCTLQATADHSGVIKSFHTDGSCTRTIDLLRK